MFSKRFAIGRRKIGEGQPVFIIAEAGVNHNGSLALAKRLVRAAKRCGADCVKFQTFRAEDVVTREAPKVAYQKKTTSPKESQYEMLRKLQLSRRAHETLAALCKKEGIIFLSTPYNFHDVDMLSAIGAPAFKLASMHLTEEPMITYVAKKRKPVILSTGMGTLSDVIAAARVFGRTGNRSLVLMQCTTDYPAKLNEANLAAIRTISNATGAVVGYSDNSDTTETCVLAVMTGAKVIEKHLTLDKNLPGPDQAASANPREFSEMVCRVRAAEAALGTGEKRLSASEARNAKGMKRSLVTLVDIPEGSVIQAPMLGFKRPATGLAPNEYGKVIGKRAKRDIRRDAPLTRGDVSHG